MIVRSHLPWPLRWAALAVMVGFSAAIALWAFEFGRDIAGLDRYAKAEAAALQAQLAQIQAERDRAQAIANTADSLIKAERATQQQLSQQLRQLESENLALKADLGFFERLLPAAAAGLSVRGLQASTIQPGQTRYQMLVMQSGRNPAPFRGRYELQLSGLRDGRPWSLGLPEGGRALELKQYARVEGILEYPEDAVVKTVQVRILDEDGAVRTTQTLRL